MTLTERQRGDLLKKIDRLVETKFYDPTFRGCNWRSIVENHRSKVLSASDHDEFEVAVNEMLRQLGSSGLGLISSQTRIAPKNSISATFRAEETEFGNRWVFQDVHLGGPAATAGVKPADILLRIGNHEILSSEKPVFAMGQTHEVLIERAGQRMLVSISAPEAKHKENPCALPQAVRVEMTSGIPVIRTPIFPGKLGIDFARELSNAFDKYVNGADRLVVDLRGNPGGGVGCLRLMSLLTSGKKPVGFSVDRKTAEQGFDKAQLPRFDRIPRSKLEVPLLALRFARKKSVLLVTEGLGARAFQGRVVLVVNEHTTCASEMVALFAREEANATIVGTATPGRLVSHTGFKIGHGFTLAVPVAAYLSWAGTRLDGNGITPEVVVDWSYSDARNGVDNQLASAINVARALN